MGTVFPRSMNKRYFHNWQLKQANSMRIFIHLVGGDSFRCYDLMVCPYLASRDVFLSLWPHVRRGWDILRGGLISRGEVLEFNLDFGRYVLLPAPPVLAPAFWTETCHMLVCLVYTPCSSCVPSFWSQFQSFLKYSGATWLVRREGHSL